MKDKRSRQKLIIKIFSVISAVILWMFVSFNGGEQMDITLKSIDINYIGEQTLSSKELMVVNKKSVPKASIRIRGKRGDLISVMSGITATIDLTRIDGEGVHKMSPTFNIPSNAVYISKVNTNNIEIEVARAVEKVIDVEVIQEGSEKNREYLVESVAETDKMSIVGEKNDIEDIEKAYLYVDVSALTENQDFKVIPVFENDKGKESVPKNDVFSEFSEINVKNTVYKRKTVAVEIQTPEENDDDFSLNVINQSVEEVEVGVIEGVNIDRLTADFSDVEIVEKGEQKFLLKLNVPQGVYLPEENRIVEVEVDVLAHLKRGIMVPVKIKNGEGKIYQLKTEKVFVIVSGPEDKLVKDNIIAEIDLDEVEADGEEKNMLVDIKSKNKNVKIENKSVFANVVVEG